MAILAQGEIMNNIDLINSVLEVKASGSLDVQQDLLLPEGKSIAELLHDQEKNESEKNESEKKH